MQQYIRSSSEVLYGSTRRAVVSKTSAKTNAGASPLAAAPSVGPLHACTDSYSLRTEGLLASSSSRAGALARRLAEARSGVVAAVARGAIDDEAPRPRGGSWAGVRNPLILHLAAAPTISTYMRDT